MKHSSFSLISPESWFKHFTKLFKRKTSHKVEYFKQRVDRLVAERTHHNIFNDLDFRISNTEIKKAINKLKRGKAGGSDGISNIMIKCSGPSLLPALSNLFNLLIWGLPRPMEI